MGRTLAVLVENRPGVLFRVTGLFSRRGYNIESLAVSPTEDPTVSRITIGVDGNLQAMEQMIKQLGKLIEVIEVEELAPETMVARELALIKVDAPPQQRGHVMQLVELFRAKVIDVGPETMIIEVTGDQAKINALLDLVREVGIREIVRTGPIALERGSRTLAKPDLNAEEELSWQTSYMTRMPI